MEPLCQISCADSPQCVQYFYSCVIPLYLNITLYIDCSVWFFPCVNFSLVLSEINSSSTHKRINNNIPWASPHSSPISMSSFNHPRSHSSNSSHQSEQSKIATSYFSQYFLLPPLVVPLFPWISAYPLSKDENKTQQTQVINQNIGVCILPELVFQHLCYQSSIWLNITGNKLMTSSFMANI